MEPAPDVEKYHYSLDNDTLQPMLSLAIRAAREAGRLLRDGLTNAHHIQYKEGAYNLVTEMDALAEKTIIEMIRAEHPDHAFLAEESGAAARQSDHRWIIDPLD